MQTTDYKCLGELFLYSSFQIRCYRDNKLHVTTADKSCTSAQFTNSNLTPQFSKFKQMRLPLSWVSCSTTLLASLFLFPPHPHLSFSHQKSCSLNVQEATPDHFLETTFKIVFNKQIVSFYISSQNQLSSAANNDFPLDFFWSISYFFNTFWKSQVAF